MSKWSEAERKKWCERLCAYVGEGRPMAQFLREHEDAPRRETFYDWRDADPEFATALARAQARGDDAMNEETLEIADDGRNDWMERNGRDSLGWTLNGEHVQRSKLRIEARRQFLALRNPGKFNPTQRVALGGDPDAPPVRVLSDLEREQRIAAIVAKAAKRANNDDSDLYE